MIGALRFISPFHFLQPTRLALECVQMRGTRAPFVKQAVISRNVSATTCCMKDFPLTKEEAFSFLEDTLQITDARKELEDNPRNFLNIISQSMYRRVPFTNLHLFGQESHFVTVPSFLEVKAAMFSRIGGQCVDFTMFTYALLSCLGYDCYICDGKHINSSSNHADVHSAIVVRNLVHPGSKHLVDTGSGVPIFRAVSLDFEKASPIYQDDYMTYRFVRKIKGTIVCQKILHKDHLWEDDVKDPVGTSWVSLFTYDIDNPKDLHFLLETRTSAVIPRYFFRSLLVIGFPKGRLNSVTSTVFYESTKYGGIIKTKLGGIEDVLNICLKYYPHFPSNMVEIALSNTNRKNLTFKYKRYRKS